MNGLREKLNKFPPFLCRFVARKKHGLRPVTDQEIADASGLSISTVCWLSKLKLWDTISLDTIERFSTACGVNLLHTARHVDFLKRRKKVHAKKFPKRYFKLLMAIHDDP